MRGLAERLIAHEASENKSAGGKSPGFFPVSQKLRLPLAALVGNTGFGALMSRALALTRSDVSWLHLIHVTADGALVGPADLDAQVTPGNLDAGRIALLAQLLELLESFVGENMTIQLMSELWPDLRLTKLHSARGG